MHDSGEEDMEGAIVFKQLHAGTRTNGYKLVTSRVRLGIKMLFPAIRAVGSGTLPRGVMGTNSPSGDLRQGLFSL